MSVERKWMRIALTLNPSPNIDVRLRRMRNWVTRVRSTGCQEAQAHPCTNKSECGQASENSCGKSQSKATFWARGTTPLHQLILPHCCRELMGRILHAKPLQLMILMGVLVGCGVNPAERNNRGNALAASGEYEDAVGAFQVAQVAAPDNAVIYYNSALALAGADRVSDAEQALQLVIDTGDDELIADAWYNLGNIYYDVGNYQSAISAYQQALLADPTHEDARYNLELANLQESPVTPTPIEMQSEIEEQAVNPEATPTPDPAGQVLPTPTPTPRDVPPPPGPSPENIGDDESGEISPNPSTPDPRTDGDLDVEDAMELLEPIEASQERISTFRDNYNETGETGTGRDW